MYKVVSAAEAVKVIKSNNRVYVQAAAAAPEPPALPGHVGRARVAGAEAFQGERRLGGVDIRDEHAQVPQDEQGPQPAAEDHPAGSQRHNRPGVDAERAADESAEGNKSR